VALDEPATIAVLACLLALAAAAAWLWLVPSPWWATGLLTAAGAAAVSGTAVLALTEASTMRLLEAVGTGGELTGRLPELDDRALPAAWLLPLAVATLGVAASSMLRGPRRTGASAKAVTQRPSRAPRMPWLALLALTTAAVTAGLYPLPLWLFVVAGLLAAVGYLAVQEVGFAAVCLSATLVVASYADGLTAIALLVALVASGLVHLTDRRATVSATAGAVAAMALAGSIWTWGDLFERPGEWVSAVGIAVVYVLANAVDHLPSRRGVTERVGIEVGAALGSLGLFVAGGAAAPAVELSTWVAVYLTLIGAGVCVHALLRSDRRELGWVGGLLLAAATWVRLADLGVREPEPYTLPSAAALLVVGLVHLHRVPDSDTWTALSAGLGLALSPSLLWVLVEPATWRAVLLGLACLVLVLIGIGLRWTAPLVWGATVGACVVVRHAAPYVGDAVPRWLLIGLAGVMLVALGVTWEQRVRDARSAVGYVRGLR
jgi:hypothetical protein